MTKLLLLFLAILNFIDGVVTYFGLYFGIIMEANPLMKALYAFNPNLFLVSKLVFSIILLVFVVLKSFPNTLLVKGVSSIAVLLYSYTFLLHSIWILG